MDKKSKVTAIIVAAGSGKRIGGSVKKQFLEIKKKPILIHTLERFQQCSDVDDIIVVVPEIEIAELKDKIFDDNHLNKVTQIISGGQERYHSVYEGIKVIPNSTEYIAVHDGVRPLITSEKISQVVQAAKQYGSAILGVTPKDTIKSVRSGFVYETKNRTSLVSVQTPQVFKKEILKTAYQHAFESREFGTDDSVLVENLGYKIFVVPGDYINIKITSAEDLFIAEKILGE
ncbi:2-C-methyl-D-erythritol 4-phosphate cytidylyltransferase [candidate division KSB1 bacterium]|nr:2-C-methyl-D-erythritol 4-phosphate cytidylyltransferase [candidate division KSB1 bacterium]